MSKDDKIDELQSAIDYLESAISELNGVDQTRIKSSYRRTATEIESRLEDLKADLEEELAELDE